MTPARARRLAALLERLEEAAAVRAESALAASARQRSVIDDRRLLASALDGQAQLHQRVAAGIAMAEGALAELEAASAEATAARRDAAIRVRAAQARASALVTADRIRAERSALEALLDTCPSGPRKPRRAGFASSQET